MKLNYIKANGRYYYPQPPGIRDESKVFSNHPVCLIKKLRFGRWRVDYYDKDTQFREKGGVVNGDEDMPNVRLILYPAGIEEIEWLRN